LDRIRVPAILLAVGLAILSQTEEPKAGMRAVAGPGESPPSEARPYRDLPIYLTEEEKSRLDEIGIDHFSTSPPSGTVRRCAQWEPVTGALIRYYYGFGLPYGIIREYAEDLTLHVLCVSGQQSACYSALQAQGVNMANVEMIDIPTNSMWTRDYGPQTVFADGDWSFVDHIYNRPRPLDDQVNWDLGTLWSCSVYGTDLVHTGGNFLYDGHGTGFSTDLVWDENPGSSHEAIAQAMEDYLGITDYVVLPDISSTGIHHIDCWMKLLNEETILVKEVAPGHPHYDDLEANVAVLEGLTNCYGRPYRIVRILCGGIGGNNVATYTNSMILNDKVFVPLFGVSTDSSALGTYRDAMPGYEVMGFTGSWLSDDAIHCRTMEIPDRHMLIVDTNPLQDRQFNTGPYGVSVYIDDRSETGLMADSLLVYWRAEGDTDFNAVTLETTAYPDSYYTEIPIQADSLNVEYYVYARDMSGRTSTRPPVAPDAWYAFNTGVRDISLVSDGDGPHTRGGSLLIWNRPDPFRRLTSIRYVLPAGGRVRLDVFDVSGRHVAELVDEHQTPGERVVYWDGRAASGKHLPGGVYYCRLQSATAWVAEPMVLLE
jgi:agmatine/peptidylarginine deiminase